MRNPEGIIIGAADGPKAQGAGAGDTVLVQLRTITGQMNVAEFLVAGISHDPGLSVSFAAYANRAYVNALENLPADAYQQLGILLGNAGADGCCRGAAFPGALRESCAPPCCCRRPRAAIPWGQCCRQHNENPMGAMVAELMKQAGEGSYQGTRYRLSTINDILGQAPASADHRRHQRRRFRRPSHPLPDHRGGGHQHVPHHPQRADPGDRDHARPGDAAGKRALTLFLLEALFLFLGGAMAGLIGAAVVMALTSLAHFAPTTPAFLMLQNGHASFVVSPRQIVLPLVLSRASDAARRRTCRPGGPRD